MLALGEALVARGHAVALQTWRRWEEPARRRRDDVRRRAGVPGLPDARAAAEALPGGGPRGARDGRRRCAAFAPDIAVSDILTPAPALAAELCGVPVATLVPHVHPWSAPGFPPYSVGARLPRTRAGAWAWRRFDRVVAKGLEPGRREYNECRARLGLAPLPGVHTGLSRALTLVATLPQLEYPRRWEPWLRRRRAAAVGAARRARRAAAGRRPGRARRAVDRAGPRAPDAARGARGTRARAGARDRHLQRARARARRSTSRPTRCSCRGCRTRARCPTATWWSRTAATGRSCARSRAAARSSSARPAATWPRTRRAPTGPGSACGCRAGCSARATLRLAVERALGDAADARPRARRRGLDGARTTARRDGGAELEAWAARASAGTAARPVVRTQTTPPSTSSSCSASCAVTCAETPPSPSSCELDADLEAEVHDARDVASRAPFSGDSEIVDVVRAHELLADLADRAEEAHHEAVRRPVVELARTADLLDPPVVHDRDVVGDRHRLLLVVRDQDGRDVDLVVQPPQPLAQLGADLGVERAERLVEQQHLRLDRQRARQRHALALAARELVRVALRGSRRARRPRAARRRARAIRSFGCLRIFMPKATLSRTVMCLNAA